MLMPIKKMGRKGKYDTHVKPYLDEIAEWYRSMNEEQIADRLGISVASFENYKNNHQELRDCLDGARKKFCTELKDALKKRAIGFHEEETETSIRQEGSKEIKVIKKTKKYYPPDVGAIHLFLKNLDENCGRAFRAWHKLQKGVRPDA